MIFTYPVVCITKPQLDCFTKWYFLTKKFKSVEEKKQVQ